MNLTEKKISFKIKQKYLLSLIKGDLTSQNTNAIVNAANNKLYLGSGVAGAIKKKFGPLVQKKCNEIMNKETNYLKNGEVRETNTDGIDLKEENNNLKYILHAVGPIYKNGNFNERKDLENCFINSFILAQKLKLESISLPPISSGIFHFPKDECADVFFTCAYNFFQQIEFNGLSSLKEIRMVIIDDETFNIFEKSIFYFFEKGKEENFDIEELISIMK